MKLYIRLTTILMAVVLLFSACTIAPKEPEKTAEPGEPLPVAEHFLPPSLDGLELSPVRSDEIGIEADTDFAIHAPGNPTLRELESTLVVEPPVPFTIQEDTGGQFTLHLQEPLEGNKIYCIKALTEAGDTALSWAYQTKPVFSLLRTYPSEGSTYVELDAGIEFEFSYDNVDISGHFSISPSIAGTFLSKGNRSVFVPDKLLSVETTYTVMLDGDITAPDGKALGEDIKFSFTTTTYRSSEDKRKEFYVRGNIQETFLTDDVPVIEIGSYNIPGEQEFQVKAYYLEPERYKAELLEFYRPYYEKDLVRNTYLVNTEGLETALSFALPFTPVSGEYYSRYMEQYLVFPDVMEEGHYLVEMSTAGTGDTLTRQKLLQINDTAAFAQSVNGEGLLWLNDTSTGEAAVGATARLYRPGESRAAMETVTDDQGIGTFANGKDNLMALQIAREGRADYWDMLWLEGESPATTAELYTSYMYVDRTLYKPTDTIQYWGILRGRGQAVPDDEEFYVALYNGYSYYYDDYEGSSASGLEQALDKALMYSQIQLEPDGTFVGGLDIESLQSDYYSLRILDGEGRRVYTASFTVRDYEKPEYATEAYTGKLFYLPGEKIDVNAKVTFFEGTPAWGYKLRVAGDYEMNSGSDILFTDENGIAGTTVQPYAATGWAPQFMYYYFYNQGVSGQYDSFDNSVVYFPSELILRSKVDRSSGSPVVRVTTHALDTSRLQSREDIYANYPDNFVGAPVDTRVEVYINKHTLNRYENKTYYDWTAKMTRISYRYEESSERYQHYTAVTKDGKLDIAGIPAPTRGAYYSVEVVGQDALGQTCSSAHYITTRQPYREQYDHSNLKSYSFQPETSSDAEYGDYYYYYSYSSASYKKGEPIGIGLEEGGAPVNNEGRILYSAIQDGILSTQVTRANTATLEDIASYIPNVKVAGAYFDGRRIYPVGETNIHYDYENEELSIDIQQDKERYEPGDEVTLRLRVRDLAGKPVASRVSLSIVDEAVFSMDDQSLDPLAALYAGCYYRAVTTYASYVQHRFYAYETGGKGGGGGGDPLRSKFPDTAQFLSVTTDGSGSAEVTFTLPDNITSWRVSSVAVAEDGLQAGTQVSGIDASLPMFLQMISNETYLAGDDVGFSARAYGTAMDRSTPIRYQAEILSKTGQEGFPLTLESKGRSNIPTNFNFGQLPAGEYSMTLRGYTNDCYDGLSYDFTVATAALELPVTKTFTMGRERAQLDISPKRYPVMLGFADAQYAPYMRAANRLLWAGSRADQRVAAVAAKRSMLKFMDPEDTAYLENISEDLSAYILMTDYSNKGVALYSFDSASPILTAKTLALLGEDVADFDNMAGYLNNIAENADSYPPVEVAAALMGLAAAKQPVLNRINERLAAPGILGTDEQLYLCTALALLGDQTGARELYNGYVAPKLVTVGRFRNLPADEGSREVDRHANTALALMAASAMNHEDKQALLEYMTNVYNDAYPMELAMYVKHFHPSYEGTARISYRRNGKAIGVDLQKSGVHYVSLMAPDLDAGQIKVVAGEVMATAMYIGGIEELAAAQWEDMDSSPQPREESGAAEPEEPLVTLKKEIFPADTGDLYNLTEEERQQLREEGALSRLDQPGIASNLYRVRITLDFSENAPFGRYTLSDNIPSPFRYNSQRGEWWGDTYSIWASRERQNLSFSLSRYSPSALTDTTNPDQDYVYRSSETIVLEYLVRRVYAGGYQQDDMLLQHSESRLAVIGTTSGLQAEPVANEGTKRVYDQ